MKFKLVVVVVAAPFTPAAIVELENGTVSRWILNAPYKLVEGDCSKRPFT
jgi:hypothetical protein